MTTRQKQIERTVFEFTEYLIRALSYFRNFICFSKPNPCGIVAFRHKKIPSDQLADLLSSKYNIAVRGGLHCAPLMHEALGTLDCGLVRASFSHYNKIREIDELIVALNELDIL